MDPTPLNYESRPADIHRPAWVYVVFGIYAATLVALVVAAGWFAVSIGDGRRWPQIIVIFAITVTPFLVGGGLLVLVPVRARRGRTITRRSIWLPLGGAAILIAILCTGVAFASIELLNLHNEPNAMANLIYEIVGVIWLFWLVLFWWISRSVDPLSFSATLYKTVLAGSVIELLVAVPMHIVVRRRTECCAGLYTGTAICVGVVTALVALGPGVFFLYHRRWKEKSDVSNDAAGRSGPGSKTPPVDGQSTNPDNAP